ncbi:hypothetical protein FOA52_004282 [Chlamydomonas sp. UWO 241]|nr:hypothetical protein FOA52_004282 [Chlamydomonas sp. UWO 241]
MPDADAGTDELHALAAIYGDDIDINVEERSLQAYLPDRDAFPRLVLRAHLPLSYPSSLPPILELNGPHLSDDIVGWAAGYVDTCFTPGEVVMYEYLEWLREQADLVGACAGSGAGASAGARADDGQEEEGEAWEEGDGEEEDGDEFEAPPEGAGGAAEASRLVYAAEEALVDAMAARIISGEPVMERKSTFQAHVAPVSSVNEVKATVAALLRSNKIQRATHNMMAYRIQVAGRDTFMQDCDDDGEAAAGGRLLHLMQAANVCGCVVVVSRWFGGVLLGPSRFALINNTARQLLEATGYIAPRATAVGKGHKGHKGPSGGKAHKGPS